MKQILIRRGDVFWVDFDPAKASEIQKTRPALVCSHDTLNQYSSRIIVAPITSQLKKVYSFEHAISGQAGLEGKIMLDQIRSVDKSRLSKKMGCLTIRDMQEIEIILRFVLGMS